MQKLNKVILDTSCHTNK